MDVINSLTNKIVNNNNITGIKRNINCIIKQKKQGKRRRSFWTHEEDEILINWVKRWGPVKWQKASKLFVNKTGAQCRNRWCDVLDPKIKKGPWTYEDDEQVFNLYKKFGKSWSKIAQHMNGRTENQIKNRFYSTIRKISKEIKEKQNKSKEVDTGILEE